MQKANAPTVLRVEEPDSDDWDAVLSDPVLGKCYRNQGKDDGEGVEPD